MISEGGLAGEDAPCEGRSPPVGLHKLENLEKRRYLFMNS